MFCEKLCPLGQASSSNGDNDISRCSTKWSMLFVTWCVSVLITARALVLFQDHHSHDSLSMGTWLNNSETSIASLDHGNEQRNLLEEIQETTSNGVQVGVIQSDHTTHRPPPTDTTTQGENNENMGGPWDAMQWLLTGSSTGDRCDWLWDEFERHTSWMSPDQRAERYQQQSIDASSFYRATSHIFWVDFVQGNWSQALLWSRFDELSALDEYATYTWVSGDLHLLNLGAWKNRHGDVVFGMNDFDEGAVQDFQFDLVRLAISIHDQVIGVWGEDDQGSAVASRIVRAFVHTYVETVINYVGNENAFLHELTPETSVGILNDFLKMLRDNDEDYSRKQQIKKYAKLENGRWKFKKGTMEKPRHKLAQVPTEMEARIRQAFSATEYGATLLKFGWSLSGRWDEKYYEVLDVAARIGSGVGSFGVDRYYVLIRGENADEAPNELGPIILDVKYQPPGSFRQVITPSDAAWYDNRFIHSAARVTEAQRKLTAFTDPFTGWIILNDEDGGGESKPFTVRERSPWKENFDLERLVKENDLLEFMEQVAFTTATSHVRGNIAQAPGDFKNVISILFKDSSRQLQWSQAITDIAAAYHEQVHIDFECFQSRVQAHY